MTLKEQNSSLTSFFMVESDLKMFTTQSNSNAACTVLIMYLIEKCISKNRKRKKSKFLSSHPWKKGQTKNFASNLFPNLRNDVFDRIERNWRFLFWCRIFFLIVHHLQENGWINKKCKFCIETFFIRTFIHFLIQVDVEDTFEAKPTQSLTF